MPASVSPLTLADCWAKTDPVTHLPALSVRDHCIDVGSVAAVIRAQLPPHLADLTPDDAALLIAAHDIGKIAPGFQSKCPAWCDRWKAPLRLESAAFYDGVHARLSQKYLAALFAKPPNWLIAVGGHHGKYLCTGARPLPTLVGPVDGFSPHFAPLQAELLIELQSLFGSLASGEKIEKGARLHWFTGLMIFSDWIGSNTTWFPLHLTTPDRENPTALATIAVNKIGWHRRGTRPDLAFNQLFGLPDPRPLQRALINAADTPGLYIVEAPMGEGKTEAALAAAYRRWTEGEESGLYFALPTQLTSNRIRGRVEEFLTHTVSDAAALALVHGGAWLTDHRIQPLFPSISLPHPADDFDQATQANRWFSDSRRAMLAPFGVGTIDQALMAVLPVKFSALRLFALSGKVVVIDEVHSYDPYTSALVDRAVEWLLATHCTVIILSATLTAARRADLVKAAGAVETAPSDAYPLITKVATGSAKADAIEISGPPPPPKSVAIRTLSVDDPAWLDQAATAAEAGACVLIIRNTIALAQSTHRDLKARCRDVGITFGLIHSRFTQADRDHNETLWTDRLGKNSASRPTGAILVGTQILEQSVDIDADLLITDLAPTDLILQRIGRLHRHDRPRPTGCDTPCCVILRPAVDWQSDAASLKRQLTPHRFVYPAIILYLADQTWSSRDSIDLPADIRPILEVSSLVPSDLPPGVSVLKQEFDDLIREKLAVARLKNPFTESTIDDLEGADTRWKIQPTAHLVLLKSPPTNQSGRTTFTFRTGTTVPFTPGLFDFPLARELHLNAVRLPRYLVKDHLTAQPPWLHQHLPTAVLAVVDEFNQVHPCHGPDPTKFQFTYHPETGLQHERTNVGETPMSEDDESWY